MAETFRLRIYSKLSRSFLGTARYPKQPVFNGCLVISNHFLCTDLESSNWNNHFKVDVSGSRCIYKAMRYVTISGLVYPCQDCEPRMLLAQAVATILRALRTAFHTSLGGVWCVLVYELMAAKKAYVEIFTNYGVKQNPSFISTGFCCNIQKSYWYCPSNVFLSRSLRRNLFDSKKADCPTIGQTNQSWMTTLTGNYPPVN